MKVLITGASSGLGKALVDQFISRECSVWGVARRDIEKIQFASGIPNKFFYSKCDICDVNEVKKVVKEMTETGFIPDVVILNAGCAIDDIDGKINYNSFKENFNINLFGAMNWVNEILPIYLEQMKGMFVAVSTLSVYRENHKNRIAYSAAKLALSKTFENLRLQYYSSGVRFIVIHPGRMSEDKSFIGITYDNAAELIVNKLMSNNIPHTINFPFLQFLLTKLSKLIPDKIFYKYILK